jgi:hypothetical protein
MTDLILKLRFSTCITSFICCNFRYVVFQDTKMESIVEQLNYYSKHGIPQQQADDESDEGNLLKWHCTPSSSLNYRIHSICFVLRVPFHTHVINYSGFVSLSLVETCFQHLKGSETSSISLSSV